MPKRGQSGDDASAWMDAQVAQILRDRPDLAKAYGAAYQAELVSTLISRGIAPKEALERAPRLVRNTIFHASQKSTT